MGNQSTRERLERAGVRPSKRMGQNFLTDANTQAKIAKLALARPSDWILEIGAGTGNLTEKLIEGPSRILALERDRRLVGVLAERFAGRDGITIMAGDALAIPLRRILPAGRVSVAGNIPYSITGEIIKRLGDEQPGVKRAVLTVQKEVADRLGAQPGTKQYGAFTILTQARFCISREMTISAGCFLPKPEVDSAVIVLERPEKPPVKHGLYALVRRLVHEAFQQRRKTLGRSLRPFMSQLGARDESVDAVIRAAGLDPKQRPETVALQNWEWMAAALRGVIR